MLLSQNKNKSFEKKIKKKNKQTPTLYPYPPQQQSFFAILTYVYGYDLIYIYIYHISYIIYQTATLTDISGNRQGDGQKFKEKKKLDLKKETDFKFCFLTISKKN